MKASDFDHKFDEGEDITAELELSKTQRPAQEQRRVNVEFPTRQLVTKVLIAERLEWKVRKVP